MPRTPVKQTQQDALSEAFRKKHKTEIRTKAQKKYDEANVVKITVKLNRKYDADIVPMVESSTEKGQLVRRALRLLLAQEQQEKEQNDGNNNSDPCN